MPERMNHIDDRLLMALACGATVEAAAQVVDVSVSTVYRRLKEPTFQKQLQQCRSEMVNRTCGMLTAAGGEFVKTLLALVKDTVPPSVRLGAARAGLELGMKVREVTEFEARVAELEAQIRRPEERPERSEFTDEHRADASTGPGWACQPDA